MLTVLALSGPGLHSLGMRKPEFYGAISLADNLRRVEAVAEPIGLALVAFQSNAEHELIA